MRPLLSMRDAVNLAQLKRQLLGVLNIGQAENVSEILYVDGTNGDDGNDGKSPDRAYKTIAAALSAAVAYDTVAVFPGTYAEQVDMAVDNVTLVGLGETPRQTVLSDTTASVTDEYIGITGSHCTVRNLMISLGHDDNVEGIVIGACDYALIEDCVFQPVSGVTYDEGIRIMGPNTNIEHVIRNCLFDTVTLGIVFEDSTTNASDVIIEGCTFRRGVTADITDSADIQVDGVVIRDCDFIEGGTDFIVLDNASTTGCIINCRFDYATHEADVITVAAGILCVSNYTVAGVSTAAPA